MKDAVFTATMIFESILIIYGGKQDEEGTLSVGIFFARSHTRSFS